MRLIFLILFLLQNVISIGLLANDNTNVQNNNFQKQIHCHHQKLNIALSSVYIDEFEETEDNNETANENFLTNINAFNYKHNNLVFNNPSNITGYCVNKASKLKQSVPAFLLICNFRI